MNKSGEETFLNTHDYMNTQLTEVFLMTYTPQLRQTTFKKKHHNVHQLTGTIKISGNLWKS